MATIDYSDEVSSKLEGVTWKLLLKLVDLTWNDPTIFVPSIQEIEILHVMSSVNNYTTGYDDLQPSIMKMLTNEYIKPLTYLINISIKQGIFLE